jgi:Putative abortive phage resistance protein AbiGi, antitoxin
VLRSELATDSAGGGTLSESQIPARLLHPKWHDMSNWVVHFTGSEASLQSILQDRFIRPSGPFGNGKNVAEVADRHKSACFSEIPLDHLRRLYERHGPWGIGFAKELLDREGGSRVWYLEKGTRAEQAVFEMHRHVLLSGDFADPFWTLTPFIDAMSDEYSYRFDWEREWRVPGGLRFAPEEVSFVVVADEGGGIRVVERYGVATPFFVAEGPAGFARAPEILGSDLDGLVARFGEEFLNPAEVLPWDSGEGGYVWLEREWDTEDAVDEVFPDMPADVRSKLIRELDGIATSWVLESDLDSSRE